MEEEIIVAVGQLLMRNAKASSPAWDYAGYMFETKDGISSGGEDFLFHNGRRIDFDDQDAIIENLKRLREITRVDGDDYWIKVIFVLRSDGDMKFLFEFEDWNRWKITPANVDRAYEILVGDVFPEAIPN